MRGRNGNEERKRVRLWISNIPFHLCRDRDTIAAFCREIGEVTEVNPPEDKETGRPKGFVFAWVLLDAGLPYTAFETLNGRFLGDRRIDVQLEKRFATELRAKGLIA